MLRAERYDTGGGVSLLPCIDTVIGVGQNRTPLEVLCWELGGKSLFWAQGFCLERGRGPSQDGWMAERAGHSKLAVDFNVQYSSQTQAPPIPP